MERLNVEVPISVGDKVYKTTSECTIAEGIVNGIKVVSTFYRTNRNQSDSKTEISFTVDYDKCIVKTYSINDLNVSVFCNKKELVKQLVSAL